MEAMMRSLHSVVSDASLLLKEFDQRTSGPDTVAQIDKIFERLEDPRYSESEEAITTRASLERAKYEMGRYNQILREYPNADIMVAKLSDLQSTHLERLGVVPAYTIISQDSLSAAINDLFGDLKLDLGAAAESVRQSLGSQFMTWNVATKRGRQMRIDMCLISAMGIYKTQMERPLYLLPQLPLARESTPEDIHNYDEMSENVSHITSLTGVVDYVIVGVNRPHIKDDVQNALMTIDGLDGDTTTRRILTAAKSDIRGVVVEAAVPEGTKGQISLIENVDPSLFAKLPEAIGKALVWWRRTQAETTVRAFEKNVAATTAENIESIPLCVSDGFSWIFGHLIWTEKKKFQCILTIIPAIVNEAGRQEQSLAQCELILRALLCWTLPAKKGEAQIWKDTLAVASNKVLPV